MSRHTQFEDSDDSDSDSVLSVRSEINDAIARGGASAGSTGEDTDRGRTGAVSSDNGKRTQSQLAQDGGQNPRGMEAPPPQTIGHPRQAHPVQAAVAGQPGLPKEDEDGYEFKARLVSVVSIQVSLIVGFVGIISWARDNELAMLGLGAESLLDGVSSALVLWRFKKAKARDFEDAVAAAHFKALRDARRERRSALGIGASFIALAVLLILLAIQHIQAAEDAEKEELQEEGMNLSVIIALPCIGIFAVMAWYKRFLSVELDSEVLKQDAKCTAFGAVLALITAGAALLEEAFSSNASDDVAFGLVDPLAASCIALLILREGVLTIRENLPEVAEDSLGLSEVRQDRA